MTAFVPMATRFSVSDHAAAKVAKPAKAGLSPSVPAQVDPDEAAKVAKAGPLWPAALSRLSQAFAAGLSRESLDLPALSQLSQVSHSGTSKPENGAPAAPPADHWLTNAAQRIAAALADSAEREADADGWFVLVRPDGSRHVFAPRLVGELDRAELLPALPAPVPRSRFAATARPPCWSDPDDMPTEGDRCTCGGGRWWTSAPIPDGWACTTCHPPPPGLAVREVRT